MRFIIVVVFGVRVTCEAAGADVGACDGAAIGTEVVKLGAAQTVCIAVSASAKTTYGMGERAICRCTTCTLKDGAQAKQVKLGATVGNHACQSRPLLPCNDIGISLQEVTESGRKIFLSRDSNHVDKYYAICITWVHRLPGRGRAMHRTADTLFTPAQHDVRVLQCLSRLL